MTRIPGWLISRLQSLPDLVVTVDRERGYVTLGGPRVPPVTFAVVPAARMSGAEAQRWAADGARRHTDGTTPLLALDQLPGDARTALTRAGAAWVERRTGYLELAAEGYLYRDHDATQARTTVDESPRTRRRQARLIGMSGRCAEALLLWAGAEHPEGDRVLTTLRLGEIAGVTPPHALYVLRRLEHEGALVATRTGSRTRHWEITDPQRILDLWAAEDTPPVRETPLYVWSRSQLDLLRGLERLDGILDAWAIGGVAAANLYAPTLTTFPALSVWVPDEAAPDAVATALGGEVVAEGATLTLRQTTRDPWAWHRLRVRGRDAADLASTEHAAPGTLLHRLRSAAAPPASLERVAGLSLVSRPRAIIEALQDGRGRAEDVAAALRETLVFTTRAA